MSPVPLSNEQILGIIDMTWPADLANEFAERAALIETGCNVTRDEAERRAYWLLKPKAEAKP